MRNNFAVIFAIANAILMFAIENTSNFQTFFDHTQQIEFNKRQMAKNNKIRFTSKQQFNSKQQSSHLQSMVGSTWVSNQSQQLKYLIFYHLA